MSFGDHLDELRRRLIISLVTVAVFVLGLIPFKQTITAIYLEPYRLMWQQGFEGYLENAHERAQELQQEVATTTGSQQKLAQTSLHLWQAKLEWLDEYAPSILDGTYPFDEHANDIRERGGYELPYVLIATGGMEDFWVYMTASFLFALILAAPVVVYQLWAFVAAGLYRHERKAVLRNVPLAVVLLLAGVAFGYFAMVPWSFFWLVRLMNFGQVQPWFTVSQYFSLLFALTAALGLVFQLPLVMLVLQRIGLVSHQMLAKQWRYVVLGIFVLAAIVTPPDPFTMMLMGLPMIALYALGLLLTWRADRRQKATKTVLT